MKIAYYALHYGSDYLGWSIRSVYDFVDQIHILYTDKPSHGHTSTMANPDSKEKLQKSSVVFGDPKGKIRWHEGHWTHEGQQRDSINEIAKKEGADQIVVVDADEIWDENVLKNALDEAERGGARNNLIRMFTLWRSFSWACTDNMMPVRIIHPNRPARINGKDAPVHYLNGSVFHFGYARSIEDIRYKISCHGHKSEWRNDWFDNKYCKWPASGNNDLHPTCRDTWNAQPYDKMLLPEFMRSHPYFSLDVIP